MKIIIIGNDEKCKLLLHFLSKKKMDNLNKLNYGEYDIEYHESIDKYIINENNDPTNDIIYINSYMTHYVLNYLSDNEFKGIIIVKMAFKQNTLDNLDNYENLQIICHFDNINNEYVDCPDKNITLGFGKFMTKESYDTIDLLYKNIYSGYKIQKCKMIELENRNIVNFFDKKFIKFTDFDKKNYANITPNCNKVYLVSNVKNHCIETIKEYVSSIINYSVFNIVLIDYLNFNVTDFSDATIIILNYDLVHNISFFSQNFVNFKGEKIMICQDEYYDINHTNQLINTGGITTVLTCCPNEKDLAKIYGKTNNKVKFINILTGFTIEEKFKSIKEKHKHIIYRGKKLHPMYGDLGFKKYEIGEKFKEELTKHDNITHDISCDIKSRIYVNWINTLSNFKTTLATPSGTNVLQYNYTIRDKINKSKKYGNMMHGSLVDEKAKYDENIYNTIKKEYNIVEELDFGQISPKMFEAISTGTVLIMSEGNYNGILKPNIHYIELKNDYSNINDIINKMNDDDYLQNIANNAYNDIIKSDKYSYKSFVIFLDYLMYYLNMRSSKIENC